MKKRLVVYGPFLLVALLISIVIKNPTFEITPRTSLAGAASPQILEEIVSTLADHQTYRNVQNLDRLNEVADFIFQRLTDMNLNPTWQTYTVGDEVFRNIVARLAPEAKGPLMIFGAHYDVCSQTPGADDNASGVAGLLEMARLLKKNLQKLNRPVELVFYTLEEPPYFYTEHMGSAIHADQLQKSGTKIDLMISMEMIGRFSDESGSQKFPIPFLSLLYPSQGNFIALIGRTEDWLLTKKVKAILKAESPIDIQSINAPASIQGIDYSDHLNYWARDMPALMVSDTSFYRNLDYHEITDTTDKLDFDRMAMVIMQLIKLPFEF